MTASSDGRASAFTPATVTMKGGVKFHVNWSLTKIQELLEMGLMG